METKNNDDSRDHSIRMEHQRPKPLNLKTQRSPRYKDSFNET